jgi:hypothetical protein
LQQQLAKELKTHDTHFSGDLSISHRHVSAEVLQLRDQERCLEEADVLEVFEMEKQKI